MLSVWNKVNKRMMQRLKTDPDAPYPKLYLTSTDSSSAPTQFLYQIAWRTHGRQRFSEYAVLHHIHDRATRVFGSIAEWLTDRSKKDHGCSRGCDAWYGI